MPKEKFVMPDIISKTVTANTKKIYQGRLNKLLEYGYKNIEHIQENPKGVVKAIKEIVPGEEKDEKHKNESSCKCNQCKLRENRRYFLTAIFYALADTQFIKTKNPLYDFFKKNVQNAP